MPYNYYSTLKPAQLESLYRYQQQNPDFDPTAGLPDIAKLEEKEQNRRAGMGLARGLGDVARRFGYKGASYRPEYQRGSEIQKAENDYLERVLAAIAEQDAADTLADMQRKQQEFELNQRKVEIDALGAGRQMIDNPYAYAPEGTTPPTVADVFAAREAIMGRGELPESYGSYTFDPVGRAGAIKATEYDQQLAYEREHLPIYQQERRISEDEETRGRRERVPIVGDEEAARLGEQTSSYMTRKALGLPVPGETAAQKPEPPVDPKQFESNLDMTIGHAFGVSRFEEAVERVGASAVLQALQDYDPGELSPAAEVALKNLIANLAREASNERQAAINAPVAAGKPTPPR